MTEINLQIEGMHCESCVKRVSRALAALPGTEIEEVRVGAARVRTTAGSPDASEYAAAVRKAGFQAHVTD